MIEIELQSQSARARRIRLASPDGRPVRPSFVAPLEYDAGHPKALAMYCSDGRFTQAVESLLQHLGHPHLDTITYPGGAGPLNFWAGSLIDAEQVERAAKFLVCAHAIEHIVLLAHAGCGYYRNKYPGRNAAEVYDTQIVDLRFAASRLVKIRPGLDIDLYYASVVDRKVRFDPVLSPAR